VRAGRRAFLAASALALGIGAGTPAETAGGDHDPRVERVLIVTLPNVSWVDLEGVNLPNLDPFFARAGIADVTTRASTTRRSTRLGDGYITLGAGTRSIGDGATDGQAFGVDEPFGGDRAGRVYTRRTGQDAEQGLVQLGLAQILDRNDALLLDAEPGALGQALADAGYARAVVANGDGVEPAGVPPQYRRQAVSALMDEHGAVPAGRVDDGLLTDDASAPYGLRLDREAVLETFREVWKPRSVVLVEASDLVRADAYRGVSTAEQRRALVREALQRSDRLFGAMLRSVDLRRDAVLVIGPAHPQREVTLTVAALRSPDTEPGLLRSATTRRSGFVQLIDVAPTVLDLLDIDRPSSMEGRPFEVGRTSGSSAARRDFLAEADRAARFRDARVGQVAMAFIVGQIILAGAAALWLAGRLRGRAVADLVRWLALALLAYFPVSYLARLVPFHDVGAFYYWVFLVGGSLALGAGYAAAGRSRDVDSLIVALAVVIGVLVVDVLLGAPLQINSALGYSPTVAGRFAGYGNLAYSALASSAVLLAALLAFRVGRPRGPRLAVTVLAVAIVADGMPFWGSDVGGVLSMVPAFGVAAVMLLGWRVRLRSALLAAGGAVVMLGTFALVDLVRPADRRTHLGRLIEQFADEGWSGVSTILERKVDSNLDTLTTSVWGLVVPVALAFLVYLTWRAPTRLGELTAQMPELRAGILGALILGALGFALNDSGIAVPSVMLGVLDAVLVVLVVRRRAPALAVAAEQRIATPVA
jgi:hypothetical protein